jgi:uncharacterized protein
LDAAKAAFAFVRTRMVRGTRLLHAYRDGTAKAPATATDYANMIHAALALANVSSDAAYITQAKAWVDVLDTHYWSAEHGGYYLAADDTTDLIVRPLSAHDDATPNSNATMVSNLAVLAVWTGETRYRERAEGIMRAFLAALAENIVGHTGLLTGLLELTAPAQIVIVVPEGGDARDMRRALRDVSLPGAVVMEVRDGVSLAENSPAHGKRAIDGKATAYVCIGPQCAAPVMDAAGLVAAVRAGRGVGAA